ncbi:uncharacterized protein K02A2.6-like [Lineus longissimus]|uniref:uncharacterized protein K02A2.6-like n=1 Tax=Lineus longissimus TaxID=88925 RepID=UPI00315CDB70
MKVIDIVRTYHDKDALILVPNDHKSVNFVKAGSNPRDKRGQNKSRGDVRCFRCGQLGHFAKDCTSAETGTSADKWAKDGGTIKCFRCDRLGHRASECRAKWEDCVPKSKESGRGRNRTRGGRGGRQRDRVHQIEESDSGSENNQDDEAAYYAFRSIEDTGSDVPRRNLRSDVLRVKVGNVGTDVVVDSGATCNLMSENTFKLVTADIDVNLRASNSKVFTYCATEPLTILGKCALRLQAGRACCVADFIVIPGDQSTLLGRPTSEKLNLLKVGYEVNACDAGKEVHSILHSLRKKYPQVFTGLGKLKNYLLKLHIDQNVKPVAQHRRIPFNRRAKVCDKLAELEGLDVIEPISGPTSWVNPLVVVEKPSGDIRLCLDMRRANEAIKREKHPVPTVDETLQEISGARVFCKLDLNMAFHQIELDESCRDITTFAGPNSLYRYKRLNFGMNMATEKFQCIIGQILKGCPGACNLHDDIRVVAEDYAQLYERVEAVIKRLHEHGLTLNFPKCNVGDSMVFMGHNMTSKGMKVADAKVKAIVEAPKPKTKAELRSFLGLAQFCARFVVNFAIITSPLCELTGSQVKWEWLPVHDKAFRDVKSKLTSSPVMAYFKQGARTRVVTDASPVGLGAILEQQQHDGSFKPVHYASRKLTHVESRYSQFEREALGVRLPIEDSGNVEVETKQTEEFARSVVTEAVPAAITPSVIEQESTNDATLQAIEECILTSDWSNLSQSPYHAVKDELWLYGRLVMRGDRIVIPEKLRDKMIRLAHEGHQGMVRTKARLRNKAWWPGIDKEVESFIRACHPCQLVGARAKPEPIKSTALPDGPWFDLAVDLLEVCNGEHLLVTTDYYSRWPEVVLLKKTDTGHVTRVMDAMFQTHGLPFSVRSDNGPPFNTAGFDAFLEYLGIEHKTSVPYWPQSNGNVERFNETLLKCIRIAKLEKKDWKKEVENFLFQYRNTPRVATGVSPAQALMGRELRDKLPKLQLQHGRPTEAEWQVKLRERDARSKLVSKTYADEKRGALSSSIKEGEKVLLQKPFRENKLEHFSAPEPYEVVNKDGGGLTLQNSKATRFRSTGHVSNKIFISKNHIFLLRPSVSWPDTSPFETTIGKDDLEHETARTTGTKRPGRTHE